MGTPTQGGRSGDGGPELLPLAAPWQLSDAPLGLYKEKAASCRFTNVQSPGIAEGDDHG
jgi:hypothetical protein